MKLGMLIAELMRIRPHVGDDAEVDVTGLYSTSGNIERVDYVARFVRTQEFVNGKPEKETSENQSTVTIKTDICTG